MRGKAYFLLVTILIFSLLFSGCVAAAAGAAVGAGTYAWASGKLTFTTPHGIAETHNATISAFKDLGIKLTQDKTSSLSGTLKGTTPAGETVTVDLEPAASNITKVDIRIGFWGSQQSEAKIAEAIQRQLR